MLLCVLSKNAVESPKSSDEKKTFSEEELHSFYVVCEKCQKLLESPKMQSTLRIVVSNESSDLKSGRFSAVMFLLLK